MKSCFWCEGDLPANCLPGFKCCTVGKTGKNQADRPATLTFFEGGDRNWRNQGRIKANLSLRPSAKEYRINDRHDYKTNNLPNQVAVVSSKQDKLLNSQLFLAGSPRLLLGRIWLNWCPEARPQRCRFIGSRRKLSKSKGTIRSSQTRDSHSGKHQKAWL